MSANIEELVRRTYASWIHAKGTSWTDHMCNALTEQAEAFKGELQSYDGMVRELNKTVEDMRAAQSVPVVGDPVAWVAYTSEGGFRGITLDVKEADRLAALGFYVNPLVHISKDYIPAAELATLREKAAMADELQKRAERMQKALSDIAEWTDRYTTPGHPVSTIASAAIAQGKGE